MADEINSKELKFTFTVDQINSILNVLGQAPFVQSAQLINLIQEQGSAQFAEILAQDELAKSQEPEEPKL